MVLFGVSERPPTALDSSAPRLLRMAPLRHSLRAAPRLDARDCEEDTASTLSAPGYGEADGGSGEFVAGIRKEGRSELLFDPSGV